MTSLLEAVGCAGDYDPDSLSVDRARDIIAGLVTPITGSERLFVRSALGRVLAADVISPIDVPGSDNSAMDGYAVRFADLAAAGDTRLRLAGTAFAGRPWLGTSQSGECVRIMTGATVPDGCDTIVVQEAAREESGWVTIPAGQRRGQHLRHAGEDLRAGQPALTAGTPLRPAELGLLASLGVAEVPVRRRLRVAVFSTGDELVSLGTAAQSGQIYDSNRYTLFGMLSRLGCDIVDLGVVHDNRAALEAAFREVGANSDVIVTSGGVSVGEADFIRALTARLGEVLFWKIAMRPGRPMAFGKIGEAWLFGLPGNPVAVMVTFYQFVRPALLRMMGVEPVPPLLQFRVPCATALRKRPGRTEFQRGILSQHQGGWQVRVTGSQGSGILRSMSEANCFIVLEHGQGDVAAGDDVWVQPFEGLV